MPHRELVDWYRFESEWPLPDQLADLVSALICTVVANLARDPNAAPAALADFLILKRRAAQLEPEVTEAERFRAALKGGG